MNYNYDCPDCLRKSVVIEAVSNEITESSEIREVNADGIDEYGDTETFGGEFSHYQCGACGAVLPVEDVYELIELLGK